MADDITKPPEAAPNDTIAANRALPVLPKSAIPPPPPGYRRTEPTARNLRLRKVDDDHQAELNNAMQQIAGRGDALKSDLGKNAKDPAVVAALATRLTEIKRSKTTLLQTLAYLEEIEDIALSDAIIIVEDTHKLLEANVGLDSTLATSYSEVFELIEARKEKVRKGVAAAREKKEREEPF